MQNLIDGEGDDRPPLPPRTGTGLSTGSNGSGRVGGGNGGRRNLLDEEPDEMGQWEVLRPVR